MLRSTEWDIIETSVETTGLLRCLIKTSNLWFLFPTLICQSSTFTNLLPTTKWLWWKPRQAAGVVSNRMTALLWSRVCDSMSTCTFSLADDTVIRWCNCCSQMEEFRHSVVYSRRALGSHSSRSVGGPPGRCSALEPFPRQPFFFSIWALKWGPDVIVSSLGLCH